jgi:GTPase SAR1 family protein
MKIIHSDGYSKEELEGFRSTIHDNLLTSIRAVVTGLGKLGIHLGNPSNKAHAEAVSSYPTPIPAGSTLPDELAVSIKELWKDSGVQDCFLRAYEYQLNDSAPYFFKSIDRILSPSYVPSEQDVLRSRVVTTGIIETTFRVNKLIYRMVDVGGQRSERRKWIQCFDDVRAVLFICALSGYDMTLFEDNKTNRLEESLNLFHAICNNKFFTKTSMILFLNKVDLFRDKINDSDRQLRLFFPQYTGPDKDVDAAGKFIKQQFESRNMNRGKIIYVHFTTATDTGNIQVVFKVVLETIIRENLEAAQLL